MDNNFDLGMAEDFDVMTYELAREVKVYSRQNVLDYNEMEGDESALGDGVTEVVYVQPLDETHEMINSGQMNIGDVKLIFQSTSIAEPEGYIIDNDVWYKIIKLTKARGQTHDNVIEIKAFGKIVPRR